MATVVKFGERKDRRRKTTDQDGHRTYSRTFYVEFDAVVGGKEAESAVGIPQRFTGYATDTEDDLNAVVVDITSRQIRKTDKAWEVEVKYTSKFPDYDPGALGRDEDPRLRLPKMSMEYETERVPIVGLLKQGVPITPDSTSIYEAPFLNAAGKPFNPQPLIDQSRPILTIVRNQDSYSPAVAEVYSDAVNADPFMGALPRQFKMRGITCPGRARATVNGTEVTYYPVTYRMLFKREGWDVRELQQSSFGTTYGSTTGEAKTFTDANGFPELRRIDANGEALSSTASSTQSVYTHKRQSLEVDYSLLNLPSSFI